MSRNAGEAPHGIKRLQRHYAKRRYAWSTRCGRNCNRGVYYWNWHGSQWSGLGRKTFLLVAQSLIGCVHLALRDASRLP
jgi:hypothetical protein